LMFRARGLPSRDPHLLMASMRQARLPEFTLTRATYFTASCAPLTAPSPRSNARRSFSLSAQRLHQCLDRRAREKLGVVPSDLPPQKSLCSSLPRISRAFLAMDLAARLGGSCVWKSCSHFLREVPVGASAFFLKRNSQCENLLLAQGR